MKHQLATATLVALSMSSCSWLERQVEENRTPEEREQVAQLDAQLDALEAEHETLREQLKQAGKDLLKAEMQQAEAQADLASASTRMSVAEAAAATALAAAEESGREAEAAHAALLEAQAAGDTAAIAAASAAAAAAGAVAEAASNAAAKATEMAMSARDEAEGAAARIASVAHFAEQTQANIEASTARMGEVEAQHSSGLDSREQLDEAALKRSPAFAGFGLIAPFLPAPVKGLGGALELGLGGLLTRMATGRGREHMKNGVKQLVTGHLPDAGRSLFKLLGYDHTNDDPEKILAGAHRAALKVAAKNGGDFTEAVMIKTAMETLAEERKKKAAA